MYRKMMIETYYNSKENGDMQTRQRNMVPVFFQDPIGEHKVEPKHTRITAVRDHDRNTKDYYVW